MTVQSRHEIYTEDHGQRTWRVHPWAPTPKSPEQSLKCWDFYGGCFSHEQLTPWSLGTAERDMFKHSEESFQALQGRPDSIQREHCRHPCGIQCMRRLSSACVIVFVHLWVSYIPGRKQTFVILSLTCSCSQVMFFQLGFKLLECNQHHVMLLST